MLLEGHVLCRAVPHSPEGSSHPGIQRQTFQLAGENLVAAVLQSAGAPLQAGQPQSWRENCPRLPWGSTVSWGGSKGQGQGLSTPLSQADLDVVRGPVPVPGPRWPAWPAQLHETGATRCQLRGGDALGGLGMPSLPFPPLTALLFHRASAGHGGDSVGFSAQLKRGKR